MLTTTPDHPDKAPGSTEGRNRKTIRLGETRIIKQALAFKKMRDAADAGVPVRYVMRKRKR